MELFFDCFLSLFLFFLCLAELSLSLELSLLRFFVFLFLCLWLLSLLELRLLFLFNFELNPFSIAFISFFSSCFLRDKGSCSQPRRFFSSRRGSKKFFCLLPTSLPLKHCFFLSKLMWISEIEIVGNGSFYLFFFNLFCNR